MTNFKYRLIVENEETGDLVLDNKTQSLDELQITVNRLPKLISNWETGHSFICSLCKERFPSEEANYKEEDTLWEEPICNMCLSLALEGKKQLETDPLWWGWENKENEVSVIEFVNDHVTEIQMQDAKNSESIKQIFEPFPAKTKEAAVEEIKLRISAKHNLKRTSI